MMHAFSDMHGRHPPDPAHRLWAWFQLLWVMAYKSSNGMPPSSWSARPILNPVSHENVSYDLDALEQVYDIISVLPQLRYDIWECWKFDQSARPWFVLHLKSGFGSISYLAENANSWRKTASLLWVRERDIGYRPCKQGIYLVVRALLLLWCRPARVKCQSKQI